VSAIPRLRTFSTCLKQWGPQELLYQLEFEHDGKSYFLDGPKYARRDGEVWKDMTTLHVTLHEGRDASGPIAGAGILSLDASDSSGR
jgi:hypothetical protein